MSEAIIHINGIQLDVGQSMTLRVAIATYLTMMQEDGLGDSAAGKAMAEAYITRASEIEKLLTTSTVARKQCEASGGHNDCPNSALPGRRYCAEHCQDRKH